MKRWLKQNVSWLFNFLKSLKRSQAILRRTLRPAWFYFLSRKHAPLSPQFGFERGAPIDRYYIEQFLALHQDDIRGRCVEVRDNRYTMKFGKGVSQSDILDIDRANQGATIRDDLRALKTIQDHTFDCIILTQVLQFIDDYPSALRELHRILKPGGTLLATVPAMSRIDVRAGLGGDYWRFTAAGAHFACEKVFSPEKIEITAYGNCRTGIAFWAGQAAEELPRKALEYHDPQFPVLIAIRAVK